MAQCSYIYASGLRIKSGEALVEIDGKVLRVVRDGKGASRLDRPLDNPPSDGEITLKDLSVALASRGMSSTKISIGVGESKFSTTLLPDEAMGRQGRQGDAAAAFAAMTPQEQQNAALYQLQESLPYSDKSSEKETKARVAAALEIVDVSKITTTLPAEFGLYASLEQMQLALAAADIKDSLRFADAESFSRLIMTNPREALEYASERMTDGQFADVVTFLHGGMRGIKAELPEAARTRYEQEQFAPIRDALAADDIISAYIFAEVLKEQAVLSSNVEAAVKRDTAAAAAALSASADPAYLAAAATSSDAAVRLAAARYAESPEILTALALDEKPPVRSMAARNIATPVAALELLATDKKDSVRIGVAMNSSTPVTSLEALMNDKKEEVRTAVASNASTPAPLLTAIAEDASKPGLSSLISGVSNRPERVAALLNPALPADVLAKLSTEDRPHTRGMVASNLSTPPEVLETLGSDADVRVRARTASNSNTPPAALAKLCKDHDDRVCDIAASNPATPAEVLVELAGTRSFTVVANPSAPREALEILAKSDIAEIRRAVGRHPNADQALRAVVAADLAGAPATVLDQTAEDLKKAFSGALKEFIEKW